MRQTLVLLGAVITLTGATMAQQQYSHGNPTPDEQYMLELINRARREPAAEGLRLMDTEDARVQAAYSYFTINAAATKAAFATYPSQPPLAFHPLLINAARTHTADMVANNFQGHDGSDGSSLTTRYQRVGYQSMGMYGENVAAYAESVWYAHCGLNVDWGAQNQIDLGHRRNIMNFDTQVYTEIGIGITRTNGGLMQGTVGPYVVTQDFGIRNVKYITGVVYADNNNNGFYDAGEGIEGVEIRTQPAGEYYTVSSESGGYALPYAGSGAVTVVASGGPFATPLPLTVLMGSTNMKLDFIPTAEGPGEVTLVSPSDGTTSVTSLDVVFEWQAAARASEYTFQLSSGPQFTAAQLITTATLSEPRTSYRVGACRTPYYWRVQAINPNGTSEWSAPYSFEVDVPAPDAPAIVGPSGAVSVDVGQRIALVWEPAADATGYDVMVHRDVNRTDILLETTSTETSVQLDLAGSLAGPLAVQPWYWSVRSQGICGPGEWSAATEVVVTVTSVQEQARHTVRIVPHPATDQSMLLLDATMPPVESIVIRNVRGEVVRTDQPTSVQLFVGLPDGFYVVTLQGASGVVASIPVVVQR